MTEKPTNLNRRDAISLIPAVTGGTVLSVALGSENARGEEIPAKREGVYPDTVKSASPTYSPAILAQGSKLLFISGQGPKDLSADMETQIRQTFENIQTVLETAGAGWENVVLIRSFFINLERDMPIYRKVREEFLVKPYPASTAVGTTALAVPGLEIEFEATAIL
ncbi:MAG: hypothetical protein KC978_23925, partial [Candidatus Omnitrophica bacterium]|nr:hypothetical protein [Candidatus Omnitrophota bacterium]